MNFQLSNEQLEYRNEVIKFAKSYLNDEDKLGEFSREMWEKFAEFGLLGITIDEVYGGLGEDYLTAAVVIEALGYACRNNGFTFVVNNHIWVAQNLIFLYGNEEQKKRLLPDMIKGKKIGSIAITEAGAGSDSFGMKTKAIKTKDGFFINGSKMFISNGPISDVFIVFALTSEEERKKISAFIVERGTDGLHYGDEIKKMGLDACPTNEMVFENMFVPNSNLLGKLHGGSSIMTSALEWERCYEFAPHVGAMERVLERCVEQAETRVQFGNKIGQFQSVSHKISRMKMNLELSKLMLYKIGWLKSQGRTAFVETSIFKVFVSESYIQACQDAMQIFGGYGYMTEYGIERELRDALACSIYSGTNEMQLNTIYNMIGF